VEITASFELELPSIWPNSQTQRKICEEGRRGR